MSYLKKPYTVCVTTYQMAVLLAFNTSDLHTYTSLQQFSQLRHAELMVTLQSLVECKLLALCAGEVRGRVREVRRSSRSGRSIGQGGQGVRPTSLCNNR